MVWCVNRVVAALRAVVRQPALRELPIPVIGRISEGALRLDLRCLESDDERAFAAQLRGLGAKESK